MFVFMYICMLIVCMFLIIWISILQVNDVIEKVGLDLVQLHGEESSEYASQLSVPCIKVIHARLSEDGNVSGSG